MLFQICPKCRHEAKIAFLSAFDEIKSYKNVNIPYSRKNCIENAAKS